MVVCVVVVLPWMCGVVVLSLWLYSVEKTCVRLCVWSLIFGDVLFCLCVVLRVCCVWVCALGFCGWQSCGCDAFHVRTSLQWVVCFWVRIVCILLEMCLIMFGVYMESMCVLIAYGLPCHFWMC